MPPSRPRPDRLTTHAEKDAAWRAHSPRVGLRAAGRHLRGFSGGRAGACGGGVDSPGMMVRVGPLQMRRILPGPEGIRFVALEGIPGSFQPPEWSELGAPLAPGG
jgi:hypothetical protein